MTTRDATPAKGPGNRFRLMLGRPKAAEPESATDQTAPAAPPEVEFVAYGRDCLLSGWVRLGADRLTDLLNAHEEVLLENVLVQDFDRADAVEVGELVVPRHELLLVQAGPPRGHEQRRRRTRQRAIALRVGPYVVRGFLHTLPGADPIADFERRSAMVPLTDAEIEFDLGWERQRRRATTLIVNRRLVDEIEVADFQGISAAGAAGPADEG